MIIFFGRPSDIIYAVETKKGINPEDIPKIELVIW